MKFHAFEDKKKTTKDPKRENRMYSLEKGKISLVPNSSLGTLDTSSDQSRVAMEFTVNSYSSIT